MRIEEGLEFILEHFDDRFPRTISTSKTQNRQILIHSKDEALENFRRSELQDCRISAFGSIEQEQCRPNLIFVDLDNREALPETLSLFHKTIGGIPTVLDTGNGYAIIQPIRMEPWKNITHKNKSDEEISKRFLQWAERYLTNYKCDSGNHPTLRSCMIRIPGSFNTKTGKRKVKIVSEWDKRRADVCNLPFLDYLNKAIKKEESLRQGRNYNIKEIPYIENLLKSKTSEGRKRIFAQILCPYLINVKKYSVTKAEKIISDYFDGHIPVSLIQYKLREVLKKNILPYNLAKMRENDAELFNLIKDRGCLG